MVSSAVSPPVLSATTRDIASRERFDHFCDALCDVYLGIRPQRTTHVDFDADVLAYAWDNIVLSRIRAPGHDAARDARAIAAKPDDALFLNFCTNSAARVDTRDGSAGVRVGMPVLLDNAEPFHLHFDPTRRLDLYSLRLPRERRGRRMDATDVARANQRMTHSRLGQQIALQTRLMAAEFDAGRIAVAGAMAGVVESLLDVLCEPADLFAAPGRFAEYTATAATHLCESGFSARDVAAIHRVSVRTVQNAFAAEGVTFTSWMAGERLELARLRISDPAWQHRSVEQIAHACGLSDPSGFHRAFRARFGDTPGAFRPAPRG